MASSEADSVVRMDGDEFDVIRVTTTQVVLVSQTTGETIVKSPAEVGQSNPSALPSRVRAITELRQPHTDHVDSLAAHLEEVATGRGRDGSIRPEYDPSLTSQETRVQRKLSELRAQGIEMGRATFYRKLSAFRKDGRSGLLDGRWLRRFDPASVIPAAVHDALLDVLTESTDQSTRTKKYLIDQVYRQVRRAEGLDFPLPSLTTMYRYLEALSAARYLTASASTRRSAAARPNRTFAKNVERLPGTQVQVDSTTLNVFVKSEDGRPKRPTLTIMLDVATRMVLAFTVRFTATKGVDHVYLLAQALTPRENRPDASGFRELLQSLMPGQQLLSASEYRELAAQQPFVRPRRLMTDNGKDYRSEVFRAAAERFGIDITLSAPHTPTSKQAVERMFGTVDDMFTQALPGYVGRSVDERGRAPAEDDLLTIDMVRALFDDWLMRDYHTRPHTSLRDPRMPRRRISPVEAAANVAQDIAQVMRPLDNLSYISLLEVEWRVITDIGIQYATRHYDSEELHPLRNTKSAHPRHNHKWPIRVDPYNPDCIWVEVGTGSFIECRERGIADRDMQPVFAPSTGRERVLAAQFDAYESGTPMPSPTTPPLPSFSSLESDVDDTFDYDQI